MHAFTRETARSNVANLVSILATRSIPVPDAVQETLTELERVEKLAPKTIEHNALRDAYLDPTATPAAIDKIALHIASSAIRRSSHQEAVMTAAMRAWRTFGENIDTFIEALEHVAHEHIANLEWLAVQPDRDPVNMIQARRPEDATRAVAATNGLHDLAAMRALRAKLTGPGRTWPSEVAIWKDPAPSLRIHDADALTVTCDTIAAGGQLWWPTRAEAEAQEQVLIARAQEHARRQSQAFRAMHYED
ncbi:hypothetical protein [Demequina sediminicola]|uniref:hypothetical protein n=1 Tax=Demequina sediminicola TaxID=1095026 RepID=UPI000782D6EF|nr:hypothetical protein [Demequina sediminicola]